MTTSRQSPIAPRFIDQAFSYRLEAAEWLPSLHLIDQFAEHNPELGAERQMVAGGGMTYAGPQSPLNHIIGLGLQGPVSKEEFDQIEDFYRRHQSVCEVVVSPYADMSLHAHLGERGYRITEWNSVLVRDLIPAEAFPPPDNPLEVRAVAPDNARQWAEVVARGFAEVATVSPDLFLPFANCSNSICFLAFLHGEVAGAAGGSIFPEMGIAPFYGAATLPQFRNRGVHNALFQARLRAATEGGCHWAVVCTLPGSSSQRNAERNGFRLAYTKVALQRQL